MFDIFQPNKNDNSLPMGQGSWFQPLTVYLIFLLVSSCWIPCSMSVANFRPVRAVPRIYRCAKTEGLADVITPTTEAERIILQESGLIIDLRSRDERNDEICNLWMVRFGFDLEDDENCNDRRTEDCVPQRRVRRIDIMSRRRMMEYMSSEWLSPFQKMAAPILELLDPNRLHEMRIYALNQRGLSGLNEAILESGGHQLCLALIEMTKHLEKYETSVIIHCVQGKDRYVFLS
jgi:Tyrosine phosphatase family